MEHARPCGSLRIQTKLFADDVVIIRHVKTMLITGSAVMVPEFLHLTHYLVVKQILDELKILSALLRAFDRVP